MAAIRTWRWAGALTMGRAAALMFVGAVGLTVLAWLGQPSVLEPAAPAPRPDTYLPAEPPPSTLAVPVALPLGILVDLLEDAVPRTMGTPSELARLPDRGRTSVAIALTRGPFRISMRDNLAVIEANLRYGLRLSYDLPGLPDPTGSCGFGTASPELSVVIRSPVSLDADWALRTEAELVQVGPASEDPKDRCEVTVLGLDVTDQVVAGARDFIAAHLPDVDERAARLDLRSQFEAWWTVLQRPIELGDSLWLAIGPERIRRGPVHGTGDSLRVILAVQARPRIHFGGSPALLPAPLPTLDSGDVEPDLDLRVDGRADYDLGSRFLVERLAGREIEIGGRSLRVDSLRVYGIGEGKLALEVIVTGDLRGRVYLTGRPVIDPATSRVEVPDLEFDIATEVAMYRIMPKIAALSLRDFMRREASWPIDPAIEWLADWLRVGLNRDLSDDLRVAGSVDTVQIVGIYAMREALLVRLAASGAADLFVVR